MTKAKLAGSEGRCDCGKVRYRLKAEPIVVKCCHCHACQRQTGSAFILNVLIEPEHVELLGERPERYDLETASGRGQRNMRCPHCKTSVWGIYNMAGEGVWFIRGGTLDDPKKVEPDLHIFTDTKLPWVKIPDGAEQFPQFYSGKDIKRAFGEEGAARFRTALGG